MDSHIQQLKIAHGIPSEPHFQSCLVTCSEQVHGYVTEGFPHLLALYKTDLDVSKHNKDSPFQTVSH